MKVLYNIKNETIRLTLASGESEHLVLLNPENVTVEVTQLEHSSFTLHSVSLNGEDSHCEYCIEQKEIGSETHLYGMGILQGKQHLDIVTRVKHSYTNKPDSPIKAQEPGGFSDQLFKFVVADEAQGSFYGELKVLTDAQKTEAHQTNRNILLSRTAKMTTKPQLEIYADDVKCSHGASTGQLDETALFYMQQRGISRHTAKRLLLSAFLSETLTGLTDELTNKITTSIEEALSKQE